MNNYSIKHSIAAVILASFFSLPFLLSNPTVGYAVLLKNSKKQTLTINKKSKHTISSSNKRGSVKPLSTKKKNKSRLLACARECSSNRFNLEDKTQLQRSYQNAKIVKGIGVVITLLGLGTITAGVIRKRTSDDTSDGPVILMLITSAIGAGISTIGTPIWIAGKVKMVRTKRKLRTIKIFGNQYHSSLSLPPAPNKGSYSLLHSR